MQYHVYSGQLECQVHDEYNGQTLLSDDSDYKNRQPITIPLIILDQIPLFGPRTAQTSQQMEKFEFLHRSSSINEGLAASCHPHFPINPLDDHVKEDQPVDRANNVEYIILRRHA